jgi:hypothetical protein
MVKRVFRTSLLVGVVAVPVVVQAPPAAAHDLEIHSIRLRPTEPVVRADGSARLVIEVVARGVAGKDGMTIKVEPGAPPRRPLPDGGRGDLPDTEADPEEEGRPSETPRPGRSPEPDPPVAVPGPGPGPVPAPRASPAPAAPEESPSAVPGTPVRVRPGFPPVATVEGAGGRVADVAARRTVAGTTVTDDADAKPEGAKTMGRAAMLGPEWRTWRFLPEKGLTRWYPMGRWTVEVTATGADGTSVTEYATFLLRRDTRFTGIESEWVPALKPSGEAAREKDGRVLRVRGVLNRVDPKGFLDYAPYTGQPVEILHRAGGGAWARVATAETDAAGRFSRRLRNLEDGEWRVRYAGNNHHAPGHGPARPVRD